MKNALLAVLVVLLAVGLIMYYAQIRHERQREHEAELAAIQQDIAWQRGRIDKLCTHDQNVTFAKANPGELTSEANRCRNFAASYL
jgi:hypothetical protein